LVSLAHWCASVFSVCSVCNVYYVRVFCCMVCGCFCKMWMFLKGVDGFVKVWMFL
jgi:hypothetical protein